MIKILHLYLITSFLLPVILLPSKTTNNVAKVTKCPKKVDGSNVCANIGSKIWLHGANHSVGKTISNLRHPGNGEVEPGPGGGG